MRVILNLQWKWKSELFSPLVAVQNCNAPQSRDLMILGQQLDFEAKGGVRGEQEDDVHAGAMTVRTFRELGSGRVRKNYSSILL